VLALLVQLAFDEDSVTILDPSARALAAPTHQGTGLEATALDHCMSRYAEGDDAVFNQLFSALSPRLHTFLRRLCGSPDLAHDLLQETFLRIHRARGSFVPGSAAVPWAYAIARNCFISQARSLKYRAARQSVDISDHDVAGGLDASAEETTAARQSAQIVERTLARMSPINREAFLLLRFEGQSVAAAAQILGTSEGAVKLRAFRAYEALRAALRATESSSDQQRSRNQHQRPA
jgi:RNA polymerase sigma-70 factor (ECF subfamily)